MEKNILYINDEYCLSLEQLKAYFAKTLQPDSSLYDELLTLQSDGLLSKWLGESPDEEELRLARELDKLSSGMADSDLMTELKRIFTGSQEGVAKPDPSQFLELTSILCLADGKEISLSKDDNLVYHGIINRTKKNGFCEETDVKFQFTFKVLKRVNEEYSVELVYAKDNILPIGVLSPNSQREGDMLQFSLPPIGVTQQGENFFLMVDGEPWAIIYLSINVVRWTFTVKGVPFDMIFVEGDDFIMGEGSSSPCEKQRVSLSSYYIGQTQVTQELWLAIMGNNPSYSKYDLLCPVNMVNWYECRTFIDKLNGELKDQLDGMQFRMPTEAEWEFAARGGKRGKNNLYKYSGSNDIDKVAWYEYNGHGSPQPVAQKLPNELGLFDMSGNVNEWCQDFFGIYNTSSVVNNPIGPPNGDYNNRKVCRGGSTDGHTFNCTVWERYPEAPVNHLRNIGLRLALGSSTPMKSQSNVNFNRERMAFMEMNYYFEDIKKHILDRLKQRKT